MEELTDIRTKLELMRLDFAEMRWTLSETHENLADIKHDLSCIDWKLRIVAAQMNVMLRTLGGIDQKLDRLANRTTKLRDRELGPEGA